MADEIIVDREAFGAKIAEIRKEKRLSQEELGNLTGIKQKNISRIEGGKYSVGLDILLRIGKAMGLELTYK